MNASCKYCVCQNTNEETEQMTKFVHFKILTSFYAPSIVSEPQG